MATDRFYFDSVAEPGITPAFDAAWDTTTDAVRRVLNTTKGASSFATLTVNEPVDVVTTNLDYLAAQFISPPLPARQYAVTEFIAGYMLASESNAAMNARAQCIVRVLDDDDTSFLGTLVAVDTATTTAGEFATTLTNRQFPRNGFNALAAAIDAPEDHRLVVEIGFRAVNTAADARSAGFRIGEGAGGDLPQNLTATTDLAPWIEILSVDEITAAAGTVFGSDDFSGEAGQTLQEYNPSWADSPSGAGDAYILSGDGTIYAHTSGWHAESEWHGAVPVSAEYDVRADLTFRSVEDSQAELWVRHGHDGFDVGYTVEFRTGSNNDIIMRRFGSGLQTILGDVAFAWVDDQTYAVEFRCRDEAKVVYVDGVPVLATSDNTAIAAGRPMLETFENDSDPSASRSAHLANFEAQDVERAGAEGVGRLRYPLGGLSPRQRTLRG